MYTEYKYNKKFRNYVDKYCEMHKIGLDEAMKHPVIRQAYLHYREV